MCSPKSLPISNTLPHFKITIVKHLKLEETAVVVERELLANVIKLVFL